MQVWNAMDTHVAAVGGGVRLRVTASRGSCAYLCGVVVSAEWAFVCRCHTSIPLSGCRASCQIREGVHSVEERSNREHNAARQVDPLGASLAREHLLDEVTKRVQEGYAAYVRTMHADNVRIEKAKLYAYLMCKQGDKGKARAAIDAYITLAQECFAIVMEGGSSVCIVGDELYVGCKDDENARRVGESVKRSIDLLEFVHETM